MKLKRVLIASFVLIVLGVLFILGPNSGITGAVIGVNSKVLDNESGFLFGFFLVWLAGIMLIGGVEEKVLGIEDLDKRRKQIEDFKVDYGLSLYDGVTSELKKRKKKASELSDKEKAEVSQEGIKAMKGSYLNFLGIKNQGNVYGKTALNEMHITQSGLTSEDLQNLYTLTPEGTGSTNANMGKNIEARLGSYMFSDVEGKNYEGLKGDLLGKLKNFNLDPKKIEERDIPNLYRIYISSRENLKKYESKDKKAA
ncbi:MAG: hypothetical protein PHV16_02380 [Candidatus Nanoarchaeia archaeon]|nr:hypothetical protein [Candidatus Nanoarchaeia archaeon]